MVGLCCQKYLCGWQSSLAAEGGSCGFWKEPGIFGMLVLPGAGRWAGRLRESEHWLTFIRHSCVHPKQRAAGDWRPRERMKFRPMGFLPLPVPNGHPTHSNTIPGSPSSIPCVLTFVMGWLGAQCILLSYFSESVKDHIKLALLLKPEWSVSPHAQRIRVIVRRTQHVH